MATHWGKLCVALDDHSLSTLAGGQRFIRSVQDSDLASFIALATALRYSFDTPNDD